ncbi:SUKH-3 domain-containing protein [Fulvivirgaceae bacterium PWU5]|uniref:SUKH-3 domain-containing protein n=1 Tax=Dawidia cretensis TaxID=2782350 RepID=A0AAP2E517_9BACT|nr:SUKH-3 domain-containing protein [Dawidia cretensis]MBT1711949.1 SUKH-3 domain-containing protein [Dawidia cretensis]
MKNKIPSSQLADSAKVAFLLNLYNAQAYMKLFDERTREIVMRSGWFEGRQINTSAFQEMALNEGYFWFDKADQLLTEFGNLKILFNTTVGVDETAHFDAIKAMRDIDPKWIKESYFLRIDSKRLCPIGQAYSNHMTLMVDTEGDIYGGYDDFLCLVGRDVQEALTAICANKKFPELP